MASGTLNGHDFYRRIITLFNAAGLPYLVGGAQMLEQYTGITRDTKDLDLYVRPADVDQALTVASAAGYKTEVCFSHWLAKIQEGALFVDVIFGCGNGTCEVNEAWFENSLPGEVFDEPIRFCPPEEMIWSKAFIMERERFDGADIAHLIRSCGKRIDWHRLLRQFEPHWRILFTHLVLFGFIYPTEAEVIPQWLMLELTERLRRETLDPPAAARLCRGTLLSRTQYLKDITDWGYLDARLRPFGALSAEEAQRWTAAAEEQAHKSDTNATSGVNTGVTQGGKNEAQ